MNEQHKHIHGYFIEENPLYCYISTHQNKQRYGYSLNKHNKPILHSHQQHHYISENDYIEQYLPIKYQTNIKSEKYNQIKDIKHEEDILILKHYHTNHKAHSSIQEVMKDDSLCGVALHININNGIYIKQLTNIISEYIDLDLNMNNNNNNNPSIVIPDSKVKKIVIKLELLSKLHNQTIINHNDIGNAIDNFLTKHPWYLCDK